MTPGIPKPVVKWRRNRVTVEEGIHVEVDGQGSSGYRIRSTLTLPALKRSDWPMMLSCSASNSDRGRPLQHQFDVDMQRESTQAQSSFYISNCSAYRSLRTINYNCP